MSNLRKKKKKERENARKLSMRRNNTPTSESARVRCRHQRILHRRNIKKINSPELFNKLTMDRDRLSDQPVVPSEGEKTNDEP